MNNSYIRSYEYEKNVNPKLKQIPIVNKNINDCNYGINEIDLGEIYNIDYKATSPNLLSSFIKIKEKDVFILSETNASSHFFYIMQGIAKIKIND